MVFNTNIESLAAATLIVSDLEEARP